MSGRTALFTYAFPPSAITIPPIPKKDAAPDKRAYPIDTPSGK